MKLLRTFIDFNFPTPKNNMNTVLYEKWNIPWEIRKIDLEIRSREFWAGQEHKNPDYLFVVEDKSEILAVWWLTHLEIKVWKHTFPVLWIGWIVSVQKNKWYGKILMWEIRNFLEKRKVSWVGICSRHNSEFYRKCDFHIEKNLAKRMFRKVADDELEKNPDADEDVLIYWWKDFLSHIDKNPTKNIIIPFWW